MDDALALDPHTRGSVAAWLRSDAEGFRAQAKAATSEFDRLISLDLAEGLDAEADLLGPSWCPICGSTDGLPAAHATNPSACGLCGAPTTPKTEVRGILGALGIEGTADAHP